LKEFEQNAEWDRLTLWLHRLLPVIASFEHNQFQIMCDLWSSLQRHQGSDEQWIRVLRSLLPKSFHIYSEYLLSTERYESWVCFHLSYRLLPTEIRPSHIRIVEEKAPQHLLPLFHQAVDRYIESKNRSSYKDAVRYIKKLKSLYQDLGRVEVFAAFLHRLLIKYNRLRAFQEEIKKGKLKV
jgi:hypothetical protein